MTHTKEEQKEIHKYFGMYFHKSATIGFSIKNFEGKVYVITKDFASEATIKNNKGIINNKPYEITIEDLVKKAKTEESAIVPMTHYALEELTNRHPNFKKIEGASIKDNILNEYIANGHIPI